MEEISASLKERASEAVKTPEIADEDKEKFLKAVLTDQPFQETVDLFDGQLKVTFRTMSVEENNDIVNQIAKDKEHGIAENTDAYFITISTYRLALCLLTIDDKDYSDIVKNSFKSEDAAITYIRSRSLKVREWPTFKLSAFLDAFNKFEAKVVKLTNAVQQQNFWKASA
jgi:hypothetical protein